MGDYLNKIFGFDPSTMSLKYVCGIFRKEYLGKVSPLMWVLAAIFITRYIVRG